MSYVELKHLLADLALEAARAPEKAMWAPTLAAYGTVATVQRPAVPWIELEPVANALGSRFGWIASPESLSRVQEVGVVEHDHGRVRIRAAFAPHLPYLRQQTTRLLDVLWRLRTLPRPQAVPDALSRGVALFNAGLFFECHEFLEDPWRAVSEREKNLYHGLIQVAAAFYHYEKRNRHGAYTLLGKGLGRLATYPSTSLGIDVEAFRKALAPWSEVFEAERGHGVAPPPYPRIGFAA